MPNTIIIFDFDTNAALKIAGSKTALYAKFRRFVEIRGFRHLQGSAYISKRPMSENDVLLFRQMVADELPWFSVVVRNAKIYRVANDFDAGGQEPRQFLLPF